MLRIRNRINYGLNHGINIFKYLVLVAVIFFFMFTVVTGIAPPTTSPPGGIGG
ncbi:MAG: hypothetical protein ACW97Z_13530 [Candidatus Hodarchaeales archaeon]|jgi:hypothetical protein